MPNPTRITHRQVQNLLIALGFTATKRSDGSMVFHHSQSGTLLLLPKHRGNSPSREADLHSVGQHLVGHGHLDEDAFEAFVREGVLPESTQA
jgi:hypothetical protein